MTTTLTLSTDTHFILMREYSAIESMEICKIKCTIVRVKVKGFWLLNLQLKGGLPARVYGFLDRSFGIIKS